jgi:putative phosphoesterase
MKIGVISDTHSRPIPEKVLKDFKGVDLIIHAGDFSSEADFKMLSAIKPVKAVCGNTDEPALAKKLPVKQIFEWNGFRIGVYHGEGAAPQVLERVKAQFAKDKVDVIVFGHSHHAINEKIKDVLYFNPGSPNDTICAPFCSYGILEVVNKQIVGKIIKI